MEAGIFLKKPVFYRHLLLGQKTPPGGSNCYRLAATNKTNRTNKPIRVSAFYVLWLLCCNFSRNFW